MGSASNDSELHAPSPGMYAVTSFPLLNLNLATLRSPEFGFFGLTVPTRRQTPFISGLLTKAGDLAFRALCSTRHPRSTWLNVAWECVQLYSCRIIVSLIFSFTWTLKPHAERRNTAHKDKCSILRHRPRPNLASLICDACRMYEWDAVI